LIFTYVGGRSSSQELSTMKLFAIAFAFASTLALMKCIVFLGGKNLNGNNDKGGCSILPNIRFIKFCMLK
jgi:hypothetical protein